MKREEGGSKGRKMDEKGIRRIKKGGKGRKEEE
jgi:hypothetical protein